MALIKSAESEEVYSEIVPEEAQDKTVEKTAEGKTDDKITENIEPKDKSTIPYSEIEDLYTIEKTPKTDGGKGQAVERKES